MQALDRVEDRVLLHLGLHGHECEDAVHRRVGVQLGDQVEDLGLARAGRERVVEVLEAHRAGVLLDLAAVELRAAVLADEDGRDAGLDAFGRERRDLGLDLFADLLGDRLAVDDLSCHGFPLVYVVRG
jgi:hypothetical protein